MGKSNSVSDQERIGELKKKLRCLDTVSYRGFNVIRVAVNGLNDGSTKVSGTHPVDMFGDKLDLSNRSNWSTYDGCIKASINMLVNGAAVCVIDVFDGDFSGGLPTSLRFSVTLKSSTPDPYLLLMESTINHAFDLHLEDLYQKEERKRKTIG